MTTVRQFPPEAPEGPRPPATPRQRLGLWLMVLGLAGILWGVFHVLGAIGGYQGRDFAHRKSDYEVRTVVHQTFPGALARALAGLALLLAGGRLRRSGGR